MKRRIGISLMMALLMILSTFTVVNATQTYEEKDQSYPQGRIAFTKTVWDGEKWWDYTWAKVGETVRFNISLTYYKNPESPKDWMLHHIKIMDILPECLEFADNVAFVNAPVIEEEIVGNIIYWNFSDYDPALYDGESMSIEFDAKVVPSEQTENKNIAKVKASECNQYWHEGEASAFVYVKEPETSFEKQVWNGRAWAEETTTFVGDIVRFKIELTYHGKEWLHDIKIVDKMPCCLEYADKASIKESGVSEDRKTVWWNLSDVILEDGQTISIEFNAIVTGITYGCHGCCGKNFAKVTAKEGCQGFYSDRDTAKIISTHKPYTPVISGDDYGKVGETLTFYISGSDPDLDDLYYWIDWGDDTTDTWIGPYASGEEIEVTHEWAHNGLYEVRVKSKDTYGIESDWSNTLYVYIASSALWIKIKKIGFGCVHAKIMNLGDDDVSDIEWTISVELRRINVESGGTIPLLKANDCSCISTKCGLIRHATGRVKITVTVVVPGEDPIIDTAYGFAFGRLIIVRPGRLV